MRDKPLPLLLLWGVALLISSGLRFWGARHPDPLDVNGLAVAFLVFGPAALVLVWLARGWTHGEGESDDCEQESR
ncbi:MAG: hypothetical protein VKK03_03075 [Synechococcus sp.]|nr:hypothetical protein [Synechococcus sp.]